MHFCFEYLFVRYDIDFFEKHYDVLYVVRN